MSSSVPLPVHARFHRMAWLVVGLIFCQILLGATVRATGSGMGCPDWPLCHGQFLPAMNFESILEYSHRLVAALVTLALTGMGAWILASKPLRAYLGRLVGITGVLIVTLITFGAVTVAYDMPPAVVAVHLELAALLVVTWVTMAMRGREAAHGVGEAPKPGVYRWAVAIAFGAAFLQLFLGAMVSVSHAGLACPDFPTCYGMWLPPLVGNVGIQMVHRFGAYTVALLVAVMLILVEWQAGERVRGWARAAAMLVVAQIGLGIATVLLEVPPALSVAHLATGMATFTVLFITLYACFPVLWEPAGRDLPPPSPSVTSLPSGAFVHSGHRGTSVVVDSVTAAPRLPLGQLLGAYYQLTKPAIVMLVVLTGLPALLIATGGRPDLGMALAALFGTAGAAASAAVFNQYFERERDKLMVRTAQRPIPSGLVTPNAALAFAVILGVLATGVLLAWTTVLATLIALGGLFFYGFFYTLVLKGSSPQNIVIGGAAGATAPLICWAAATGTVGLPAWIMFAIVFFWTPPHFWALAIFKLDDYVAAKVPMFPVVYGVPATARWIVIYSLMLVPISLLLLPLQAAGPIYFVAAMALGLGFLGLAFRVWQTEAKKDATRLFAYSIVYTLALFSFLTLDAALGGPALTTPVALVGR